MHIETYECEELKNSGATTMAADAESIELIQKLGLEGQQTLADPETCTRQPYREMTALELYVWRTVCPETTDVRQYRHSPIPLRVLQVIAYARELGIYEKLEVWHPKQVIDDPLLVGVPKGEQYGRKRHLIARWGETLVPFEKLIEQARKAYQAEVVSKLDEIEAELEHARRKIANRVELAFSKHSFDMPTWYHIADV